MNFSCRIPKCARGREVQVDIIEMLKRYASIPPRPSKGEENGDELYESSNAVSPEPKPPLIERLGDDFARGHVQASGGIVNIAEFEELMDNMQIGVKPPKKQVQETTSPGKKKSAIDSGQKNNLMSYFSKTSKSAA